MKLQFRDHQSVDNVATGAPYVSAFLADTLDEFKKDPDSFAFGTSDASLASSQQNSSQPPVNRKVTTKGACGRVGTQHTASRGMLALVFLALTVFRGGLG
jgi:hypothetical protein